MNKKRHVETTFIGNGVVDSFVCLFFQQGFTSLLFHSLGYYYICHLHHLAVLLHSKFSCLHHESQCKASLEQPFKRN